MSAPSSREPSWEQSIALLDRLPTLPTSERIAAVEQLFRSSSPLVRDRALRSGAVLIPDDRLEAYLRSDDDDVARNAGLEMLKLRGPRGFSLAIRLLRDPDADVVLQAVLALGHSRDLRALEPLRGALDHPDTNVVQAAIDAVGRLGEARAVTDLLPFLESEPWLQMAAIQALGELRDRRALAALGPLLTDLLVGPLVAEAVARIGGPIALRLLTQQLLRFGDSGTDESLLGLLAHVLEGLPPGAARPSGLVPVLQQALESARENNGQREVAVAAARCLLCLGPSASDETAILALAGGDFEPLHLPTCLERRTDLVALLLARPGSPRCWGFLMIARQPRLADEASILAAIEDAALTPDLVKVASRALQRVHRPGLAAGLLDVYRRVSPAARRLVLPLVATQRRHLPALLREAVGLGTEDRLLLAARAGVAPKGTALAIAKLAPASRLAVLEQLADLPELTGQLPWSRWLEEDPERWCDLAALVAVELDRRELLPALRARLTSHPSPAVIRAVGDLGDRESLPQLAGLVDQADSRLVPLALEAVGRIGGPEARAILRRVVMDHGPEERMAFRALSICAAPEDDDLFRAATRHPDWYVRLACAEVLGRFSRPENLEALAQLADDSVPLVAQRALSFLES